MDTCSDGALGMAMPKAVALPEAEAWEFLERAHTGIFTTLRRSGSPLSLPVWFVALERRIYVTSPGRSAKVQRVRRDPRVCFLVEEGRSWTEVRAVVVAGTAELVEDAEERSHALVRFSEKYRGLRMPRNRISEATRAHYGEHAALIRITPADPIVSWDNARVRLQQALSGDSTEAPVSAQN